MKLLDLIDGLALCPHCCEYVKPKYYHKDSKVCICPTCLYPLRNAKAKRRYEAGYYWCSRCADFRIRKPGIAFHCCIECSTKLRSRSYTKHAKAERESTLIRY